MCMGFGENLRQQRLAMGWTQQQLADRMGKTKNNISQYELGKREPNCDQLLAFSRLLGISTDELLRDRPEGWERHPSPTPSPDGAGDDDYFAHLRPAQTPTKKSLREVPGSADAASTPEGGCPAPVLLPVYAGLQMSAPIGYRYAPGDRPEDDAFFFVSPDDSMGDYRIRKGDMLLIARQPTLSRTGIHLIIQNAQPIVRMLHRDPSGLVMLQASSSYAPQLASPADLSIIGPVMRVEFSP